MAHVGKERWILIEKELESESVAALVQDEQQVGGVRHDPAGAELPAVLPREVFCG